MARRWVVGRKEQPLRSDMTQFEQAVRARVPGKTAGEVERAQRRRMVARRIDAALKDLYAKDKA